MIHVIAINPMFSNRTRVFGNVSHSIFISPSLLLRLGRRIIHSLLPPVALVFTFWKKDRFQSHLFFHGPESRGTRGKMQGSDGRDEVLSKLVIG